MVRLFLDYPRFEDSRHRILFNDSFRFIPSAVEHNKTTYPDVVGPTCLVEWRD